MKLPKIRFDLKEWCEVDFQPMQQAENQLKKLAGTAGQHSDVFNKWCQNLMQRAHNDDMVGIIDSLGSPISFRALAYLLRNEPEFFERCPLDSEMLMVLLDATDRISRQGGLMLVGVFLERFDQIGSHEQLTGLGEVIGKVLSRFSLGESELNLLQRFSGDIFIPEGPVKVVSKAINEKLDLDLALLRFGLSDYSNSRFVQICRYRYYIETLKVIALDNLGHSVLQEIIKPQVYEAPGDSGEFIGHEILRTVIDRVRDSKQSVPEHWRNIVLTIAGDPRVPKGNQKYQRWWQILGEEYERPVIGWLSQYDLSLFLEIIEDYGKNTNNTDLNRMFPGRKRLLEGLLANGVVKETRLFLCPSAEYYLRRQYQGKKLPSYATVQSSIHQTLIYLNIDGCHMIEGSHSCKLWIFPKLPSTSHVTNYSSTDFSYRDLTAKLEEQYLDEFNSPYESITHSSSGRFTWENRAIHYLEGRGVKLDKKLLFDVKDYQRYRRIYGV